MTAKQENRKILIKTAIFLLDKHADTDEELAFNLAYAVDLLMVAQNS